jgi:rRNA-processing protein CGR1
MQKTQKALAIKKLQAELKDEKEAEYQRCELFSSVAHHIAHYPSPCSRRAITLERKQHAEEKRRLEEAKAQVRRRTHSTLHPACLLPIINVAY